MLLFILYQMDDCIILKFSYKYLLLLKRAAYRYMQAVVDEIIFGNVDQPKPVLRPTVSMRDILSRKQVLPEECVVRRQAEKHPAERQKVALSQMLQELREDLSFPKKTENIECDDDHQQKQFFAQRRKFGFIHISLPLTKQSKKKMQALNPM